MTEEEVHGVHDYVSDPRNADVLISVNGALKRREEAVVSVFDSGYLLGDGVWEGLRVLDGGVAFWPEHLKRLYAGAKTIDMDIGLAREELTARLMDCLKANGMQDGVHIRLMVTRGIKKTPLSGAAVHDRQGDHRDHPGIQDAGAGGAVPRGEPVYRPRPPDGSC